MEDFKVGDTVFLKAGSNPMTIKAINGNEITCSWLEGYKLHEATFSADQLTKEDERPAGVVLS